MFIERLLRLLVRIRVFLLKRRLRIQFKFITQGEGSVCVSGAGSFNIHPTSQLKSNAYIECSGGVEIGRYFHCGRSLTIFSTDHAFDQGDFIPYSNSVSIKRPVVIEDFVWAGANVTICPGAKVGEGCILGAGAVVVGALEPYGIYAGNPARKIGERDVEKFQKCKELRRFF